MSGIAIRAENISKLYQLGTISTGTVSRDLNRWWAKINGKEDPYSILAASNNRSEKAKSDFVWSLKDVDFEIKKGEAVGVIGRNGAGKSTLLKILSRVTSPTTGNIKINGRIASLLEVGTGFNPELTGRENIYMNGAILGMNKTEITRKLPEIVDFSGCEAYIDTPVKRYSSGMYVRLAFAVAAHLEPEILIVDEVLAVGDAEFQKKCLGKMQDVNSKDGRTVLFVSHNMASIQHLTSSCILLANGNLAYKGDTATAVKMYLNSNNTAESFKKTATKDSGFNILNFTSLVDGYTNVIRHSKFRIEIECLAKFYGINIGIGVNNQEGVRLCTTFRKIDELSLGINEVEIQLESNYFPPGNYIVSLGINILGKNVYFNDASLEFNISEENVTEEFLVSRKNKLGLYIPNEARIN